MAVVCIDAGTTMIKAVGYDEQGNELVVVRKETTVSRPQPGWAQQDMESVWDAVVHTVRGVVHELQFDVDYVAITAQGDGCWLVDDTGAPTGPAPRRTSTVSGRNWSPCAAWLFWFTYLPPW